MYFIVFFWKIIILAERTRLVLPRLGLVAKRYAVLNGNRQIYG